MKPYIICHMMASLDGRIDCCMTELLDDTDNYYVALDSLECDATLEGRVTLFLHYAKEGKYEPTQPYEPAGKHVYKAKESDQYAVGVDTLGTLVWGDDTEELFGRPLIMVLSEKTSKEYLEYLKSKGISYITTGTDGIDLANAVDTLNEQFGVKRLAVVGGGHINGAFLEAGLLDEVSMMIGAGIDGRKGWAAAFDGIEDQEFPTTILKLKSVQQMGHTVWMRYDF